MQVRKQARKVKKFVHPHGASSSRAEMRTTSSDSGPTPYSSSRSQRAWAFLRKITDKKGKFKEMENIY